MRRWTASGPRSDRRYLLFLGAAVVFAAGFGYAYTHGAYREYMLVANLVPVAAIMVRLRRSRADRLPWLFLLTGAGLGCAVSACWLLVGRGAVGIGTGYALLPLLTLGSVVFFGGAVALVLRHAPRDKGSVIDAALIGVGGAGPLWEFLVRPRMLAAGATPSAQLWTLLDILAVLAVLGALVGVSVTARAARRPLLLMFGAILFGLARSVLGVLLTGAQDTDLFWPELLGVLAWLVLAAAALHPAAAHLTVPDAQRTGTLSRRRLVALGVVLAVNPVVGAVPELWGGRPDGLLLGAGTIVVIVLVLIRIQQLVEQRTEAQEALAYHASHDELTGLENRRSILARLDEAIARWSAEPHYGVAVMFCDLDGFKPVNDAYGHQLGDALLRSVADRLVRSVRPTDVVGRIGGDEFLIVCAPVQAAEASALRYRLERLFSEATVVEGQALEVGLTVGLAVADTTRAWTDGLVAAADHDMYTRKHSRARPRRRSVA